MSGQFSLAWKNSIEATLGGLGWILVHAEDGRWVARSQGKEISAPTGAALVIRVKQRMEDGGAPCAP